MKFLIVSLALLGAVMADVSELSDYGYQAPAATEVHGDYANEGGYSSSVPVNSYIPPAASAPVNSYIPPAASVPESSYVPPAASAPVNSYIPPAAASAPVSTYVPPAAASAPVNTYIPPAAESAPIPTAELAEDGYRYKTNRRRVYRQRY